MKRNAKFLSIVTVAIALVAGGLFVLKNFDDTSMEDQIIGKDALPVAFEKIDDSTRAEATAHIYREVVEGQSIDENGDVNLPEIEQTLKEETQIENFQLPSTVNNEREPIMTALLKSALSRTDGSTNEIKDPSYRIVEEKTFVKWEVLFSKWVAGELSEVELKSEWGKIKEALPPTDLTKPTVLKYTFPHSESAFEMIDDVMEAIDKNKGSTTPHIAFVDVYFDKEESQYTIYYVESHVEVGSI